MADPPSMPYAARPVCGQCQSYLDSSVARVLVLAHAGGPAPADRLAWCNRHGVIVVSELPQCTQAGAVA